MLRIPKLLALLIFVVMFFFLAYGEKNIPFIIDQLGKSSLISAIYGYFEFLLFITIVANGIKYFYDRRHGLSYNSKNNIHFGIDNIARLLISLGLIVAIFGAWGIDMKSLFTSLSIVAAAIAIISKDFINDFLVGLYYSFSKDFEINDYVKLQDQKGKIIEIGMLKIKLLNDDDDIVVIPNTKIYVNDIVNFTKRDLRLMSIDFQMDINKVENIIRLEKELISSLTIYSPFIEENSYNLKIVEMKKDSIDFKFQYQLRKLDRDVQRDIRKQTVRRIFSFAASKANAPSDAID